MHDDNVLILGAGWGGLAAASLLAKHGYHVTILEAQDRAGGCGQSFTRDGFSFCAEMQYLMDCGPGGVVHDWLCALDLQDDVTFNALDPDGYDRIDLPGLRFRIPHGTQRLRSELEASFPDEIEQIGQIFAVLLEIEAELEGRVFDAAHILGDPLHFKTTLLYGPWSVKRVFEHFGLSATLQAVLAGQCGDLGLGPKDEPFLCLQAVLLGYCKSAHFPKQGMGHFVEKIETYIRDHGGEIQYLTPVTSLESEDNRIVGVNTTRGRFSAGTVLSNIDPAATMSMIAGASVPGYQQSLSCFTIFLGVDIDLSEHGFGRFNIWNYPDSDIDGVFEKTLEEHNYEDPFFFLSTPSLYTDAGVLAPPGSTTVQINVASDYDYFEAAMQRGDHDSEKARVADQILSAVERRLLPDLRAHCVMQEAWSPVDLASRTGLARGGMYGARLDFSNRVFRRVSQQTEFTNLFLTGATAGGPGMQGVVAASGRVVELILTAKRERSEAD